MAIPSSKKSLDTQRQDLLEQLLRNNNDNLGSEVIKKIASLRSLNAKEKALFLTQINTDDGFNLKSFNLLVLAAHLCPHKLPDIVQFIKTLPPAEQDLIFELTRKAWSEFFAHKTVYLLPLTCKLIKIVPVKIQEAMFRQRGSDGAYLLTHLAVHSPYSLPLVLELVEKLPVALQEEMLQQVDALGRGVLLQMPPKAFLMSLRLIKKFSPEAYYKITNQKNYYGEGLEFYIVNKDFITLLNQFLALGFNFNLEVKNNLGEGLLQWAVERGQYDMVKVLISEYGLKPDTALLIECAEKRRRRPPESTTPEYYNNLYNSYLDSLNFFVKEKVMGRMMPLPAESMLPSLPKELSSIILDYVSYDVKEALKDPQELKELEASIDRACKLRAEWLKPLIDYCAQKDADLGALACLKALLDLKKLTPKASEEKLDALLKQKGLAGKAHTPSLIKCRENIEKVTGSTLNFSLRMKATLRFYLICDCAIIGTSALVIGLIALGVFNAVVAGIAVTALSSIALGAAAYGFYAHKKNPATAESEVPALIPVR